MRTLWILLVLLVALSSASFATTRITVYVDYKGGNEAGKDETGALFVSDLKEEINKSENLLLVTNPSKAVFQIVVHSASISSGLPPETLGSAVAITLTALPTPILVETYVVVVPNSLILDMARAVSTMIDNNIAAVIKSPSGSNG